MAVGDTGSSASKLSEWLLVSIAAMGLKVFTADSKTPSVGPLSAKACWFMVNMVCEWVLALKEDVYYYGRFE
jgi:hypothetical protein